jgi:4-amino-4-deoxy-L-arabinose transferase-like glycosyltransferase
MSATVTQPPTATPLPPWSPPENTRTSALWVRPALATLLAATALLYLWGLDRSGWANSFYAAAVQAGAKSWKAMFFGSSDAANFITVDKPPISLWVMDLSARMFGINAWSMLVPQALEGVAAVGVLYLTVRRWFGPVAGLLAGATLALTPVAVLMFRFNNPDAMLTLLLTLSAYALVRALEAASWRWLAGCAALIGCAFLTKTLQAFLVVPGFVGVYLLAAPTTLRRRLVHLLGAGGVLAAASLWWVVIVQLWPASSRPYIGGSQNNSEWNLIFGYNGLGRITGSETGSVVPGAAGRGTGTTSMWGPTGWSRLFNAEFGGQASWLIPGALIVTAVLLALLWRARRTDRTRAALLIFGSWLVISGLLLSYAKGIIHPYYTVALAPAIGALIGSGGVELWRRRDDMIARSGLAVALAATGTWAFVLLGRTSTWLPWLRIAIVIGAFLAAIAVLALPAAWHRAWAATAVTAVMVSLAGPAAYAISTARVAHSGSLPTAGPSGQSAGFGPGGRAGAAGFRGGVGGPGGAATGGVPPVGTGTPPALGAGAGPGVGGGVAPGSAGSTVPSFAGNPGGAGGGGGGFLNSQTPSAAVIATLDANASKYTWVAAAVGSDSAAGYQLATGHPVMALGGFNGSDPYPTLAYFEKVVAEGKVHYFIGGSGGFGQQNGGSNVTSQITAWVKSHFTATTVGSLTLYDLTSPKA